MNTRNKLLLLVLAGGLLCCPLASSLEFSELVASVQSDEVSQTRSLLASNPRLADTQSSDGRSLLHLAISPEMISVLLDAGVDPTRQDGSGRTAFDWMLLRAARLQQGRAAIEAMLLPLLSDNAFMQTINVGQAHTIAQLGYGQAYARLPIELKLNAEPNSTGGTMLHSVAQGGIEDFVEDLISAQFDVNAVNRYGATAVWVAARYGHDAMVDLLFEHGASPVILPASCVTWGLLSETRPETSVYMTPPECKTETGFEMSVDAKPSLFSLGFVSTMDYNHSIPVFSPDGLAVYWGVAYTPEGAVIYESTRATRSDAWSSPHIFSVCEGFEVCMYPTLSSDGEVMFFVSDRAVVGSEPSPDTNIWRARKTTEGWGELTLVGFDGGNEYGLTLQDDGTLYFMSDRDGGFGVADLYRSSPNQDGRYPTAINLGEGFNTEYYEDEPYISPNGCLLLFASNAPNKPRLNAAIRADDGNFGAPFAFSDRLTGHPLVRFPGLDHDLNTLYFASVSSGTWDIYAVTATAVLPEIAQCLGEQ